MLAVVSLETILETCRHNAPSAAVLAVFVSAIAYVHSPRVKTLIFSMPVPFTCAYLATHHPIDATNVVGLFLSTSYHWMVFAMVRKRGWPIGVAIAVGVAFFIVSATLLRPMQDFPFLAAVGFAMLAWFLGFLAFRPRAEKGHRSTAPWWLKVPLVFLIALVIYAMTGLMGGAVLLFPYAGTFTSYEMRHSLRSLAGYYMINCVAILALLIAMWSVEHWRPGAQALPLVAGWAMLGLTYFIMHKFGLRKPEEPAVPTGD